MVLRIFTKAKKAAAEATAQLAAGAETANLLPGTTTAEEPVMIPQAVDGSNAE